MTQQRKTLSENLLTSKETSSFIDAGKEKSVKIKEVKVESQKDDLEELVPFATRLPKKIINALTDYCYEAKKAEDGRPTTQQAVVTKALVEWFRI